MTISPSIPPTVLIKETPILQRGDHAFPTLEDLQGTLDVILFPNVYHVAKPFLDSATPLLITGVMEMDSERGEPYMKDENLVSVK